MQASNPAQRRYTVRFLTAMTGYVVALLTANYVMAHHHPQGVPLFLLSLLPALPLLVAIAVMGIYLREEQDEYIRAQIVRGIVLATGMTLAACTVWGFLEEGGIAPHQPAWIVFPVWAVALGIARGICALGERSGA